MRWFLIALYILAQEQPRAVDIISGGAGWVGTGIFGTVLVWLLMVRMPTWDKILKENQEAYLKVLESKDKTIQEMVSSRTSLFKEIAEAHDRAFAIAEKDRREDFQQSLQTVATHCQRESEQLREMIRKDLAENSMMITDLRRTMEDFRESIIQAKISKNP